MCPAPFSLKNMNGKVFSPIGQENRFFPTSRPTLRQAVRLTAKLGGFLGRKWDANLEQMPFGLAFSDSTTSQACISSWLPLSSHIPKTHPCPSTQVVGKDQAHDGRTHASAPYRFQTSRNIKHYWFVELL